MIFFLTQIIMKICLLRFSEKNTLIQGNLIGNKYPENCLVIDTQYRDFIPGYYVWTGCNS